MGRSDCAFGNQTCLCADEAYNNRVTTCVIANCTIKQQLVTKNQTLTACGHMSSMKSKGTLEWLRLALFVLPTFFFGVRVTSKIMKLSPWGWDDTILVFAYLILAAFLPANYLVTEAGAGRDMWTLTPDQINRLLLVMYIFNLLYSCAISLIKASIILLYLRIFPNGSVRKILWGTFALNFAIWAGYLGPTIYICRPISFFWTGWAKESEGECINMQASAMSHGVFQVALDAVLLVIPATQIWGLNMSLKKKLGVYLIFGAGIFLTAVSSYRIQSLHMFATSNNPTVNTYETAILTNVELCTGIFVACLPATRQLWKWMVPSLLDLTSRSKTATSKNSTPGNRPPLSAGYAKKSGGGQSWLSRVAKDADDTVIALGDIRSTSATSLVESKHRPPAPAHFGEV
ncbi:CFEM domain-containing protein [Colletotrichum sublineola]|nr:CFEM domain-containing protein [Colletotrichum sublineola]